MTAPSTRALTAILLALALGGCRAPEQRPVRQRLWRDPTYSWFGTTLGVADRGEGDVLRDGPTLGLAIGQDLAVGAVRPSLELLLESSYHRRRADAERVQLWRLGFGGRLSVDWSALRATPYVQGGAFYRGADASSDVDPLELDPLEGSGAYAGAGLLFWTPTGAVGPFFRLYRDEDDREEWLWGVTGAIFF